MRAQVPRMPMDGGAFLRAPVADGAGEARIGDPVPAAHQGGQEAARDLVPALRAGFEAGESFAQAVIDALVIAGLEMQAGMEVAPQ